MADLPARAEPEPFGTDIEVTLEMADAGALVIMTDDRRVSDPADLAERVYVAMSRVSRRKRPV
jgi:hypothetical protein